MSSPQIASVLPKSYHPNEIINLKTWRSERGQLGKIEIKDQGSGKCSPSASIPPEQNIQDREVTAKFLVFKSQFRIYLCNSAGMLNLPANPRGEPPPKKVMQSAVNNTIAVAMSGGVDSSTVAAMLSAEGYELVGLTIQLWNQRRLAGKEGMPEQVQGRCCSLDDVYDARRVAEDLDIPYYVVNQQERFEHDVVRPFVKEYLAGRTPIPCSLCNDHLKFDQLLITRSPDRRRPHCHRPLRPQ